MDTDTDMVRGRNTIPRRPEFSRCVRWSVLGVLAVGVAALPGVAAAQSVRVTPTLNTELTWTDNVDAEPNGRDDFILEVTPGVSVSRTGGRMTGRLNARLRNLMYANDSDANTSFVSLNGSGTFEAIEDLLFIDASAGITRNNLSAFSGRGPGDPFGVDRENETRTWSITPRLESDLRFGEAGRGSVRYSSRGINSNSGGLGNQRADTCRHDHGRNQMPRQQPGHRRHHHTALQTCRNRVRPIGTGGDDEQDRHGPERNKHTQRHGATLAPLYKNGSRKINENLLEFSLKDNHPYALYGEILLYGPT